MAPPSGALEINAAIEGAASTLVSTAGSFGTNYAELALANSVLNNAEQLLNNSYSEYLQHIAVSGQPINFSILQDALNNTLASLNVGAAATQAISDTANLNGSIWSDIKTFAAEIFTSSLETILGAISELGTTAGLLEAPIHTAFDIANDSISLSSFETSLQGLITAAQTAVISSSPFSPTAIANDLAKLTNSVAETQGEVLGSSTPPPGPQPIVSAKSTDYTQINAPVALDLLFTPSITPVGTSDEIDHYTLINTLEGPGELVVNNLVYNQPEILNVTRAEFQSAYFVASQPGTDEIDVVAFDSAGNSSNFASSTITISATNSSPPTNSTSDLKVPVASLISSDLVAGGGGTVAFSVENLGASAAPNAALSQIYLSTHTTLDSSAILVSTGAVSDAGLASSASLSEQLPFTLPTNVVGSYYLIVFAGDADQVTNGAATGRTDAIPISVTSTSSAPPAPSESATPSGPSPISITEDVSITTRVGSEPAITSGALHAADNQYPNDADLRYVIVTPPAYGHLIDDFFTTSTFTQADIDNELVDYVQNGTATSSDSFSFYVTDPAGYRSAVQTFTFNILPALSLPPPSPAPAEVTVALASDTGLPSDGGPAFSTSDPTLTGTANPGATVSLIDGSTALGSVIADSAGNWSFSPPSGFSEGSHSIAASVTISGQTATNFLSFAYDTIAPPAPSTPQLSLGGNVADTSTPTFSGTAEANDQVLLLEGNSVVGSGMATPQGTWTIESGSLSLGYHNIIAELIDPAGNISPLSGGDTIEVIPPPPGEVTLNDAAMIAASDLVPVGSVSAPSGTAYSGTVTEYGGPIFADGFTLTNISRSAYSLISWGFLVGIYPRRWRPREYYDGPNVLIVPTNFLTESPSQLGQVNPAIADTIDLKRTDGAAFDSFPSMLGPRLMLRLQPFSPARQPAGKR